MWLRYVKGASSLFSRVLTCSGPELAVSLDAVSAHLWVCKQTRPQGTAVAIYSLSHKPIGKSTQTDAYTASAHILYITRARALHHVDAERMPCNGEDAADWMKGQEDKDRANGRVIDKVMLALPRELSPEQRVKLVRQFAEGVTKGRAPWLAAFHDNGADAHNPHCHLVLRDRDVETGKRVIGTSEKGSTEKLREAWETHANATLEEAGERQRIDRRTLTAQGISRKPTIHEGVKAREIVRNGRRPISKTRSYRNGRGARSRVREIDYERIDRGCSRVAYNRQVHIDAETEKDFWSAIDADSQGREIESQRRVHRPDLFEDGRGDKVIFLMKARELKKKRKLKLRL